MVSLNVANGLPLLGVLVTGRVGKSDCKKCREVRCGCLIWLYNSAALKQLISPLKFSILSKSNPIKHFQHICASTLFSMTQIYEGLNSQPSPWHSWMDECVSNLAAFTWTATETESRDQLANFKPGSCYIPVILRRRRWKEKDQFKTGLGYMLRPDSETNKQRKWLWKSS